jgi:hypothetical protein
MFVELMREEMAAAAQDEEHMMILGCLSSMYAGVATGRRGGSAPSRRKCKPNLLNFMSNLFEICQMGEVGGFLPGGRLELRRFPGQIFLQSRRKFRRI